ncbi:MAG: hypothetical protein CVU43_04525 [Chloroflexi bacterium HGW-Chloroflexi-5]|jgi:signal recognition particle GTPase|nr:MAG: hypothetical protein CVU43_04525 [Chloroflexi bacterium HGW-Chloroflexi-5]
MESNNQQQNNQQGNGQQQNNQQSNGQQGNQQQGNQQQQAKSWDDVLKEMPEETKALYEQHTTGLKNTVQATRDERDGLKKQLEKLLPDVEKGSKAEAALTEALGKLEMADKRANFAEQAIKPEIGCRNVKAAFALATASDLFKKNGDPDWESIKKEAPELFGAIIPDGDAGSGAGGETKTPKTNEEFNAEIRRKANL